MSVWLHHCQGYSWNVGWGSGRVVGGLLVPTTALESLARFGLVGSETEGPTVALDGLDLGPSGVIRRLACKRAQCGVVWLHKGVLHCHQLSFRVKPATFVVMNG